MRKHTQQAEVDQNYEVFKQMLPELLRSDENGNYILNAPGGNYIQQ